MRREFTSIENIVAGVLLEIGDEKNRQFYTRALQWTIDEYRRLYVHRAPFYREVKVQLDTDRYYADYPEGTVKVLAAGVYRNGLFAPFTKSPNLSKWPPDASDNIYEEGDNEGSLVPDKGFGFAARSRNIGYWADDPEECKIYVRNYRWDKYNASFVNNTSDLTGKIIVRVKTTGIDCWEEIKIPYEYRELIIALVTYRFMMKNIPTRSTQDKLTRQQQQIEVREEEFYELTQGIQSLEEVKDAIYSSLNTTARR